MRCSICGKDFGIWATISGHAHAGAVCTHCQEQGLRQLRILAESVHADQEWKQQYAERWLTQFEDTTRKLQIPESQSSPLRFTLLNGIFKLVEQQTEISDSDYAFLVNLESKYRLVQSPPDLRELIVRIALLRSIQSWERGNIPTKQCVGLVLQRNELCHWEEPVGLRIRKVNREYVGGYASVSIPIGRHGTRVRVGGFKGYPIDKTIYADAGKAILHITSQRVCITAQSVSMSIPYAKMINLQGFEDGLVIQTTDEKRPGIFTVGHPELTARLINLAATNQQQTEPPSKGRKRSLSPA